jgi:hypothetical protein
MIAIGEDFILSRRFPMKERKIEEEKEKEEAR